MNLGILVSYIH